MANPMMDTATPIVPIVSLVVQEIAITEYIRVVRSSGLQSNLVRPLSVTGGSRYLIAQEYPYLSRCLMGEVAEEGPGDGAPTDGAAPGGATEGAAPLGPPPDG